MNMRRNRGFTLIELLTVIAIIMILVGFVTLGLSRMLLKAKEARAAGTMRQLQNSLAQYFTTQRETYPPRYGYLTRPFNAGLPDEQQYCLRPYPTFIGVFGQEGFYDEFSDEYGHDANQDGWIHILEFSPLGRKVGPNEYEFDPPRLTAPREPIGDEAVRRRPLIYLPVSRARVKKVAKYYYNLLHSGDIRGANAAIWPDDNLGLRFPPTRYDAFALVGVGPMGDTGGVVPTEPCEGEPPDSDPNSYHIRTLRAFYLATRDANENMKLDFDYRNRTGGAEDADLTSYEAKGLPGDCAHLPNPAPGIPEYGPYILVYGYSQ